MESVRFDALTARLATTLPRRRSVGLLAALGVAGAGLATEVDARKKKKKKCKGCTECQACKKGKCKPKPEGSACIGGLCAGGGCACFNGFRSCQGRCIADDQCCTAADCGQGGSCQNGTCLCTGGFKRCGNRCIPQANCCDNSDCTGGKTCLQSGACALVCTTNPLNCPGTCDCTGTAADPNVLVCFSYGEPPTSVCSRPACSTNADCGAGEQCLLFDCVPGGEYERRCVPLC